MMPGILRLHIVWDIQSISANIGVVSGLQALAHNRNSWRAEGTPNILWVFAIPSLKVVLEGLNLA
jgi:hypothetical protein